MTEFERVRKLKYKAGKDIFDVIHGIFLLLQKILRLSVRKW